MNTDELRRVSPLPMPQRESPPGAVEELSVTNLETTEDSGEGTSVPILPVMAEQRKVAYTSPVVLALPDLGNAMPAKRGRPRRKKSAEAVQLAPTTSRKRRRRDDLEAELAELREGESPSSNALNSGLASTAKSELESRPRRTLVAAKSSVVDGTSRYQDGAVDFRFTAVITYNENGFIQESFDSRTISKPRDELWRRIEIVQTDIWEARLGAMWQLEFTEGRIQA